MTAVEEALGREARPRAVSHDALAVGEERLERWRAIAAENACLVSCGGREAEAEALECVLLPAGEGLEEDPSREFLPVEQSSVPRAAVDDTVEHARLGLDPAPSECAEEGKAHVAV